MSPAVFSPLLTGCFLRLGTCSFSVAHCSYLISCFAIMHSSTWIEEGMRESKSIHVSALETYFTLSSHLTFSYVSLSSLSPQPFLCQLIAHSFSLTLCFCNFFFAVCGMGKEWELSSFMYGEDQFYSGEVKRRGEARGTRVLSPHALTMRAEQQRGSSQSRTEREREGPWASITHLDTLTHLVYKNALVYTCARLGKQTCKHQKHANFSLLAINTQLNNNTHTQV